MFNFTLVRRLATKAWGSHTKDCVAMFYKHAIIYDIPVHSEGVELGDLIALNREKDRIVLTYERIIRPDVPPIPVDSESGDSLDDGYHQWRR
jgi:hypothetical protein